ncbi:hypothetical protein BHE74_00027826 [Ensete ventricosum]|nr:hypothetical protein BHE74_00027826 [Ensete ventricosum]
MINLITQLADYSVWRHRSRMSKMLVVVGAILRYWSRTPGLVMRDAATSRHGSRMPRCNGEEFNTAVSERESDVVQLSQEASCRAFEKGRAGDCVACSRRQKQGRQQKIAERVRSSATLVWASTGDDRGRWTSVPNRSVEEQQIWIGITRLDAQAAAEEGLSWPRLPRRIRRCGCRSRREWGFRRLLSVQPTHRRHRSTPTRPLAIESPIRFL